MSPTSAPPSSSSSSASASRPQRVVFPNAHACEDLKTPYAQFRRHVLLFVLYFLWICGVGFFCLMTPYSAFAVLRTVVTVGAFPVPWPVQWYLLAMALYYSYHAVVYSKHKPQGVWLTARNFCRRSLVEYPYFRHCACIFDGREEESLKEPLKPMVPTKDKSLFAYHPHGVLSIGFAMNGVHAMRFRESDARWLVAENLLWFPLLRDILRWLEFDDVSKRTFLHHMKQDRNVCVIPGGFEEATLFQRGKHRVFIKKRFGFIKLALQHGYKVHPAYTFGEEETFHSFHYFLKLRMKLNAWKVPGVVFFGRLLCFFMPLEDVEITTVVGKPIALPTIEHPTKEDVAKYHKIYIDALVDLFERYKHKYAVDPSVELEVY